MRLFRANAPKFIALAQAPKVRNKTNLPKGQIACKASSQAPKVRKNIIRQVVKVLRTFGA